MTCDDPHLNPLSAPPGRDPEADAKRQVREKQMPLRLGARFARIISWIGHPLVFVPVSLVIVVTTRLAPRVGIPILGVLFLFVIAPIAILLFAGVRSGRWRDADVSVREERRRFYRWAIPFSAVGALAIWLMRAPAFILRGVIVTLALFILAAIINLRLKISLHILFAFYCAVILLRLGVVFGVSAFILAALVSWSRLLLGRHTLIEATMGGLMGVAGGIVTAWLSD